MNFWKMSDGIRLHQQPHQDDGYHGDSAQAAAWLPSLNSNIDTGHNSSGGGGDGSFFGTVTHAPVAIFNPLDAARAGFQGNADADQSNMVQLDQHAVQIAGMGGNGENDNTAAGGNVSAAYSGSGLGNSSLDSIMIQSGADQAGNGGDGYSYGGIIHASFILYEPINIAVAVGYGSSAHAEQTNNVSFDQSAIQIAGAGGNGGNGNTASGGNVSGSASGADLVATGGNHAGNGGDGYFFGSLVDAPVVIYHPINIAIAGGGGTAEATQSNIVEIDQSAIQIAGVGGNGGNGNTANGGDVSMHGTTSGSSHGAIGAELLHTGDSQAGNGGDGFSYGGLVHASFAVYSPVNITVAGHSYQMNNVHLDQSTFQMAGAGGNGGNSNAVTGGDILSDLRGGSDAIATGGNGAGNGGSGHFAGSMTDVSIAIYAPINIAIAGPHSTADAYQTNNVLIDQSAVQIAGTGGHGGHGNLASGGDVAMHLLSDLHLMG
jgi:hypothetical protein